MYRKKRHTKPFNLNASADQMLYEDILNNPLATVLEERIHKEKNMTFEDGQATGSTTIEYHVVTWEVKELF